MKSLVIRENKGKTRLAPCQSLACVEGLSDSPYPLVSLSPYSLAWVCAALLVAMVVCPAWAQTPTYDREPSGEYLRKWLLCGPFPLGPEGLDTTHLAGFETDFLAGVGGEGAPRLTAGMPVAYEGGTAACFVHESQGLMVDLDQAVSEEPEITAYAYCEVASPRRQACVLALGSNDGARVWLNGERIWDRTRGGSARIDDHLLPVVLREGTNTLLLKVEERGGTWQFCCRLLPLESEEIAHDRLHLFRVETSKEGRPTLRAVAPRGQVAGLIEALDMVTVPAHNPDRVLWEGGWTGRGEMPLGVDTTQYGEYVLRLRARLLGGVEYSVDIPFTAGKREAHVLFEDGKTDYAIVVGKNASESEQWAAQELRQWLGEMSGADFPLVDDAGPPRENEILVGVNARSREALGGELVEPDPSDQSFRYRNAGSKIVIWGGSRCGTMYGVFSFLEREFGCRWYTPRVTVVPKRNRYAFYLLDHGESPGIRVRNDFYYEAFDPTWAARNKVNGELTFGAVREQPGGVESYWRVHTFNFFVPPEEFFENHPEYYSLIDGERTCEHAQLCLTNPDVLGIITERVLATIREHPEHLIYSVSQNDGYGPCQCDACQAVVEREGSESGPILELVNAVAEEVEKEFPDKFVGTLAYVYSRKPPKTLRPRRNVVIRLCSFDCCRSHALESCPINASFVDDIEKWSLIAPRLYIWDYVVNFGDYIMPFPNFHLLQPNMRFFRDHNAIGVMPQAAYQSRGGEFAELRAYVLGKLLWNPDCDVKAVIDDFMGGYYGRSGQHVRAYFDLLQGLVTPDTHIRQFAPDDPMFTAEFIRRADDLFDRAEIVADSDAVRERVEMAHLPLMYLKCKRTPLESKRDGTYARFCAIVEREGITHYSEAGAIDRVRFHEEMDALE